MPSFLTYRKAIGVIHEYAFLRVVFGKVWIQYQPACNDAF
ncbi:hypothetical protein CBM2586_A10296 [Cupriavidus phytorum]|uniref:Uncharacterized protein n=1 Tax=Cupriavidus taiwanensis TaxID=164546 RepID=A0A975WPE1_9BURK|nr:hypothetical protein CBM2586_A10296 [Cupriavidus taiwanensis]